MRRWKTGRSIPQWEKRRRWKCCCPRKKQYISFQKEILSKHNNEGLIASNHTNFKAQQTTSFSHIIKIEEQSPPLSTALHQKCIRTVRER